MNIYMHILEIQKKMSFRPQQGLTIMNMNEIDLIGNTVMGFRPQQGLTIMNKVKKVMEIKLKSFRPQQGLTIMNKIWKAMN